MQVMLVLVVFGRVESDECWTSHTISCGYRLFDYLKSSPSPTPKAFAIATTVEIEVLILPASILAI